MEKIKRFLEMTVPVTRCNLKCSYCYIIQHHQRGDVVSNFKYSPQEMGEAISQERLGGIAFINLCGKGETLLPNEMPEIVFEFLKQGHYVNITTNGTITKAIMRMMDFPKEYLERLIFNFSCHYEELVKRNLLKRFVDSVNTVQKAGCSFCVKLNLADEYIKKEKEIKEFCLENFGAYPVVAATRDEQGGMRLLTSYTEEEYIEYGKSFNSPLFDYSIETFMDKKHEFCYAGEWSLWIDMENGLTKSCMGSEIIQNIFDLSKPIKFEPIGYSCRAPFCVNANIYRALGTVPENMTPTFVSLRDRDGAHWFNERAKEFLSQKLYDNNEIYFGVTKFKFEIKSHIRNFKYWIKNKRYVQLMPRPIYRIIHFFNSKVKKICNR